MFTVVGQFRKCARSSRSPSLKHSPASKHCHPSLRSEAVCSVNCCNAEWGIRCLVMSTESRSPRRRPRRRDDSLGVFGVSDNQFFIKLTHHPILPSRQFRIFSRAILRANCALPSCAISRRNVSTNVLAAVLFAPTSVFAPAKSV